MEEMLTLLYHLQHVDQELDELEELKGDLPQIVAELEATLKTHTQTLQEKNDAFKETILARERADLDIHSLTEKLERYKKQQYEVRTNKEYDMITKEIENAEGSVITIGKQFDSYETTMDILKKEIGEIQEKIDEAKKNLAENERELKKVLKLNEDQELSLRQERDKIIVKLKPETVERYNTIREARHGTAIVRIQRNSCGGCHNRIPPQKLLDLRSPNKLYICERCGRIVIPDDIPEPQK